ncbi:hypothetical protein [Streptomyces sp. NPDC002588]|uniref:hypothetical protein n=1 Tax=Streptomyces sp. NPDC002588 TaxID=3154419 RepID=UPI003316F253
MSARETFEDRLLEELKREIELRGATGAAPVPVRRRALTPRRVVLALAACAAVALAPVVMPGSPGGSAAYAVERHGDGSVTLTVKRRVVDRQELAKVLGRDDIKVTAWGSNVALCLQSIVLRPGDRVALDDRGNPVRTIDGKPVKVLAVCPASPRPASTASPAAPASPRR